MDSGDFLTTTRVGYDHTAGSYERFQDHLSDKPLDLAILSAIAALVTLTENKRIVDVGCGTAATTAILHNRGVDPFGIDPSPNMIDRARRLNPGLRFDIGSMTDLDVPSRWTPRPAAQPSWWVQLRSCAAISSRSEIAPVATPNHKVEALVLRRTNPLSIDGQESPAGSARRRS